MRIAALWMMITAMLILSYIWTGHKFFLPNPEPWPSEKGEILSSRVRSVETETGQQFKVDILYRYRVGESLREGNRIRPSEMIYASMEQAQGVAKAFPAGKEVKVYVNPNEKSQPPAVLLWEFPNVLSPVVFIIIVLFGSAVVFYLVAEYRKYRG
ncbi:MAG: DUF3592 domain-containing protein [Methylococcales bacterium]